VLAVSLVLNLGTFLVYLGLIPNPIESETTALTERFYLGDRAAKEKIAVVRVSGVLTDSSIQYPIKQLEAAARDEQVKAVVLRIDSPGGTISASEELYQNILNVRDNTGRRFRSTAAKPVHTSMGGLAASGGYYIAVAGKSISAEKTTITGSIGVFVALPNVAELAHQHGVKLELVKAGAIKASGSFFHELTDEERQTWQDIVDGAYDQFLNIIVTNRPVLGVKELREKVVIDRAIPKRDEKGNPLPPVLGVPQLARYTRVLADGGTYSAEQAMQFKLIDRIEDLPAVIRSTAETHGVGTFKAVVYDRHPGLVERLTGLPLGQQGSLPGLLNGVSGALAPRLWYLAPSADAGLLVGP
jgi:protease-4